MLKKDQLRVRIGADKSIRPNYVSLGNADLRRRAAEVTELFSLHLGRTRGDLEEELGRFVKGGGDLKINRGMVELALGMAEFEGAAAGLAQEVRSALFAQGARHFPLGLGAGPTRREVVAEVARQFACSATEVERLMFADLKEAQLLESFSQLPPVAFLQRYNLALAQGLLVHAVAVDVTLRQVDAVLLRQIFAYLKFFELLFEVVVHEDGLVVHIDGPMSVLKQTKSYGVKLATFLPALLLLESFELVADVRWKRRRYTFTVTPADGLVTHYNPRGGWVPRELTQLRERLQETLPEDIQVVDAAYVAALGGRQVYVPDFEFRRGEDRCYLEVLWPWKKLKWSRYYEPFAAHAPAHALVCVSTKVASKTFQTTNRDPRVVYYRATPLADRIVRAVVTALGAERERRS
jgi:predicted nuclease of restriction endonuclease-like RecB superfamily